MGKKEDLNIVKSFKKKISESVVVEKIILFGSRVDGKTNEWSDYDIMIVSDNFKGIISYKRAPRVYDYWEYDYPVDFLCYTLEEFNELKKRATIVREAVKRGIEI